MYTQSEEVLKVMFENIKKWKYSNDPLLLLQVDNYRKHIKKEIQYVVDMIKKEPKSPFNKGYMNYITEVQRKLDEANGL